MQEAPDLESSEGTPFRERQILNEAGAHDARSAGS